MPIYAYKCASCGFAKDVLLKISDAPLTDCPECGVQAFSMQVTAAGFQLKGSGWYVTDFRGGSGKAPEKSTDKAADKSADKPADKASDKPAESKTAEKSESKSAEPSPPKTGTPSASGGCGASCACH